MKKSHSPFILALELIRPKWTLEIIYHSLMGCRRFDQFQNELGLARNLLSQRLSSLTAQGIFKKVPVNKHGKRSEYRITEKGLSLLPMMIALHQWSEHWIPSEGTSIKLIDATCEAEIAPLLPRNSHDKKVDLHQIKMILNN